tara:strand:+ start:13766 stop:15253 length:1488 start_codon:yes stop_codon:yes gene_type:complete
MPAYYLEIAVVALGLILLLAEAFISGSDKRSLGWVAILGLAVVYAMTFFVKGGDGGFWDYYTYDEGSFAGFFKGIALIATIIVIFMSMDYHGVIQDYTSKSYGVGEFYVLPIFTCAGLMWAASAIDLISIFVAIELVSISFYVLVAFMRRNVGSLEAGVKYLILGALSTGFMVYGITWIFGATGQTNLALLEEALSGPNVNEMASLFGFALLMVSLGFKVGAFPFNVWIPDVYQGAPTPITAFLSVASKSAGFIVLVRVIQPFMNSTAINDSVILIMMVLAGGTMIFGNLVAILQTNFKRLMAYSSISHAGFLLLALACAPQRTEAMTIHPINAVSMNLGSYTMMTLLAFFVLTIVRAKLGGEDLATFKGLSKRSPFLAFALLIAMAALAGIPLTSGFFGKFFVFRIAVQAEQWLLLGIAILAAGAGFYYYFKVVKAMYFDGADLPADTPKLEVGALQRAVMLVLVVGILIFGFNPRPLLNLSATVPAAVTAVAK